MDDFKDPKNGTNDEDEETDKEEDIDPAIILKQAAKAKGKNKGDDTPHAFDVHTPNEVFSSDDELPDPRFDEDDPAINDSDEMDEDEEDELVSGANFFSGSDFGSNDDLLGYL